MRLFNREFFSQKPRPKILPVELFRLAYSEKQPVLFEACKGEETVKQRHRLLLLDILWLESNFIDHSVFWDMRTFLRKLDNVLIVISVIFTLYLTNQVGVLTFNLAKLLLIICQNNIFLSVNLVFWTHFSLLSKRSECLKNIQINVGSIKSYFHTWPCSLYELWNVSDKDLSLSRN